MKLLDVINAPWAIIPEKLEEIRGIYETHLRGEKINLKDLEAQIGRPLERKEQGFTLIGSTAVIPIDGVTAKKMNLFMRISGGSSTELIGRDFRAALADDDVESIVFDIDSPGGSVDGTQELARLIFESRGTKPLTAFANGMMASAAYWIGAAADTVVIAGDTTAVGSIGVVATHVDVSVAEAQAGIRTTEITAGRFKRAQSQFRPLSEEGRQTIQDQVDFIYGVFVNDIADFRDASIDDVLANMADGKVFLGDQGIDAGLVDGRSTFDQLISAQPSGKTLTFPASAGDVLSEDERGRLIVKLEESEMDWKDITADQLEEHRPDLVLTIANAARDRGHEAGMQEGREAGAVAERERIQSVEDQLVPGHEDLITQLKFDGKTSGEQAAVKVLQAEKAQRKAHTENLAEDAPDALDRPVLPEEPGPNAPIEERAKSEWDRNDALHSEFQGVFERYLAFRKSEQRAA